MEEPTKQTRMLGQSWNMLNLPLHIVMEIISRLPIKTVMSIRCVCKSLLSLVSDSHFQMLHFTRAPTELMFSGCFESSTTLSIAEYVFVNDSLTEKKNNFVFELPNFENHCDYEDTQTKLRLVNTCNGLVCFKGPYFNRFAAICNPFTNEYIELPCPDRTDNTIDTQGLWYGLGFSRKDNCFKLVRVFCLKEVGTGYADEKSGTVGEIYTFGEEVSSWKRVANRPDMHLFQLGLRDVIFHEGVLHWYCIYEDAIVTFDLDTELFGKLVTPPRSGNGKFHCFHYIRWSLAMGVFDNCLYTTGCVGDYFDIWALKEYGQGSWVKIFSIPKDGNNSEERYEPFKYLQNGKVLMFKNCASVVCFDPNTGSVKNVGGFCSSYGSIFIRPSLVSLKVLLGDSVEVHSVEPWDRIKSATTPPVWESSVAVEDVLDSQGCSTSSSSEASASTSHSSMVKESEQDGSVGQSSSEIQKLADKIETLEAENEEQGKVIAKLKKRKRKDRAFMRFMYQQLLNVNPNMPACPMSDDSSSSDDSD